MLSLGPVRRWLYWDKAEHFCGGFAILMLAAIAFPRIPVLVLAAIAAAGAGAAELAQMGIAGRSAAWSDFLASFAGVGAALAAIAAAALRRSDRHQPPGRDGLSG